MLSLFFSTHLYTVNMVFRKALIFWAQLNVILNLDFPNCLPICGTLNIHMHTHCCCRNYTSYKRAESESPAPCLQLAAFLVRRYGTRCN